MSLMSDKSPGWKAQDHPRLTCCMNKIGPVLQDFTLTVESSSKQDIFILGTTWITEVSGVGRERSGEFGRMYLKATHGELCTPKDNKIIIIQYLFLCSFKEIWNFSTSGVEGIEKGISSLQGRA